MSDADFGSDHDGFGVLDEATHTDERTITERARYLAKTTDLNRGEAETVAASEMGFSDTRLAKQIGIVPVTATKWLDRAIAQYGLTVALPKPVTERGDLVEVTCEDLANLVDGEREQRPYRSCYTLD